MITLKFSNNVDLKCSHQKTGEMSDVINVLIKLNGDNLSKNQLADSYTLMYGKNQNIVKQLSSN